jgi:hypothetical protein
LHWPPLPPEVLDELDDELELDEELELDDELEPPPPPASAHVEEPIQL